MEDNTSGFLRKLLIEIAQSALQQTASPAFAQLLRGVSHVQIVCGAWLRSLVSSYFGLGCQATCDMGFLVFPALSSVSGQWSLCHSV